MLASSRITVLVGFAIAGALAGAPVLVPAQTSQAPRLPDPARLPSRPGLPGTGSGVDAPPRDPSARRTPATGTAAVGGRVVALDTGLPLRRARVMLYCAGQPRVAITDADGAFSFAQLPAGRYTMNGSKARYVDTPYGGRRPGGPGRLLELADGQAVDDVVLALAPAGVITGRVLDDAGEVVTGAMVAPLRFRTFNGERQLTPAGPMRTSDDTGTFRLFGLAPGKYYLSARDAESQRFGGEMAGQDSTGFAPTFYPGTAVASEAQPIEVVAGAEIVADVQLVTTRLTTITGVVVDATGAPATGGHLMVAGSAANAGRFMSGGPGGAIRPDGTFTLSGLAPGEYTIVAQASFGQPSMFEPFGSSDRERKASATVVASGAPISGLRLVVLDPIRIPVAMTFEDGGADKPERVMVQASAEGGMNSALAAVRDGRLSLEVVPGSYRLSVTSMSATPWFVKRIAYRGQDVQDDEVELTAEPGGRIDVLLTTRSSSVTGTVTDDTGKPAVDYMVIILPEDAERLRRAAFHHVRVSRPDPQGRFRAQHLQPGRYLAVALEDTPFDDIHDADFLDGVRRLAKPFTLTEGESATVALSLSRIP